LTASAERYRKALTAARARLNGNTNALRQLNTKLIASERQFLAAEGLKRRPWFKHTLYAPGFYTGYAVKTMPGVREGIEQRQYAEAEAEAGRLSENIKKEAALIDSASEMLEQMK
jgi:N-acetylated-alpha-linked acidic dipeptidase